MTDPIESMYLHIGNSGFSFNVENSDTGPCLKIHGGAFGHTMCDVKMFTSPDMLKELGEMLVKASEAEFNPTYCHAAMSFESKDKDCCDSGCEK